MNGVRHHNLIILRQSNDDISNIEIVYRNNVSIFKN